jgi:hypothetical protein
MQFLPAQKSLRTRPKGPSIFWGSQSFYTRVLSGKFTLKLSWRLFCWSKKKPYVIVIVGGGGGDDGAK